MKGNGLTRRRKKRLQKLEVAGFAGKWSMRTSLDDLVLCHAGLYLDKARLCAFDFDMNGMEQMNMVVL